MPGDKHRTAGDAQRRGSHLPGGLQGQAGASEAVLHPSPGSLESGAPSGVEHLKSEFISTVSHELRTPLTAIRGAIGLVLGGAGGPVPPAIRDLLEIASSNTERLIDLVNEILEVFRMEEGKLQLCTAPASVSELVGKACAEEQKAADAAGVRVETCIAPQLPLATADGEQVEAVLRKLLSNAIQFSDPGGTVRIGAERLPENAKFLLVWVQDCGRGTSLAAGRIAEHDDHSGRSLNRLQQGSGLGLAICRGVVEAHGGQLWVQSEPEKGATVYLTLPTV